MVSIPPKGQCRCKETTAKMTRAQHGIVMVFILATLSTMSSLLATSTFQQSLNLILYHHQTVGLVNAVNNNSSQADKEASSSVSSSPRPVTTSFQASFENLELFVSCFPGKSDANTQDIRGFAELEMTLVRSLQFFWPSDPFKLTVALDDTVYKTLQERDNITSRVKSMFNDRYKPGVSVAYNPRSNQSLYGDGWFIQQLIMFWADNFTNSEYIGFVDDDTLFARAIHAYELFDEHGRPRAIVHHASFMNEMWAKTTYDVFGGQWPTLVSGMNYFPVIIKRKHLQEIRNAILEAHSGKFAYFDEWYTDFINTYHSYSTKTGGGHVGNQQLSQFVVMLDYVFHHHRDDYAWHFEEEANNWGQQFRKLGGQIMRKYSQTGIIIANDTSPAANNVTMEMLTPFPRVAVHGSYPRFYTPEESGSPTEMITPRQLAMTRNGRPKIVDDVFRKGYCYSQPTGTTARANADRGHCQKYKAQERLYDYIWAFGYTRSLWVTSNETQVVLAQRRSRERNPADFYWDPKELANIFRNYSSLLPE